MEEEGKHVSDKEYFDNKRNDKVYLSKQIPHKIPFKNADGNIVETIRPLRYISRIINSSEGHEFVKQGGEIVLRITPGEKQEIVATVYEDTRGISTLKVAKYNREKGTMYKGEFTLIGSEIAKLVGFINSMPYLPIYVNNTQKQQFTDEHLDKYILNKSQALKLLRQFPELVDELFKGNISDSDVVELSKRKESLTIFEKMLGNAESSESDWQKFFEENTWIFGYSLNFVFNAPLEGRKLEQVVAGYSVGGAGKRIDALMARKGAINATCFVEIKKHSTALLSKQYRAECFAISDEVAGGVSQVQKSIQKSIKHLSDKIQMKDDECNPTNEILFNYQPKGYLVIGSLSEFNKENGINEDKYGSFELFRRNLSNPEIITFDELYERAKFIVATSSNNLKIE